MYSVVELNVDQGIGTILLNRPEANNAFDYALFAEVKRAIEQYERDDDVRVVIITGKGKHFSVGGDIGEMTSPDFISMELTTLAGEMSGAARKSTKPIIAKINGTAAGAGCALALACDFRIMTKKSTLMTAFINVALPGDSGVLYHLYHHVGLAKAVELMALSQPISGEEALRLGLATKVVSEDGLHEKTLTFAQSFLNRPTAAFAKQKQIIYEFFYHDYAQYCQREAEMMFASGKSNDHLEAVSAFLEKRKPSFLGK